MSSSRVSSAAAGPSSSSSKIEAKPKDAQDLKLTVGSRVIICQDTKLSGEISIASGCVLHPLSSLQALGGPIILGPNCLLEENVNIINSSTTGQTLTIGVGNLFEVGSRVEMLKGGVVRIGDWNSFEIKARVIARRGEIKLGDWCKVGVGVCLEDDRPGMGAGAKPTQEELEAALRVGLDEDEEGPEGAGRVSEGEGGEADLAKKMSRLALPAQTLSRRPSASSVATTPIPEEDEEGSGEPTSTAPPSLDNNTATATNDPAPSLAIPNYSVLHSAEPGSDGRAWKTRQWSGEGIVQDEASFTKHLEYLREVLPRQNKLRKI
ncbi:hypothetical protein BCV69DRAFT_281115 [Microstroma glucosiphilum]|uniref:Dynactin subunit 6 n=1 Tax=Pseudomicrostroma glucosiphilum TaxID=1684307 RepID=A0A316UCI3_9BASI|nr:hypothetical protein BCV69DRAFT_281115 [Pseudomicrostroma glucosiphilum]PWN22113.1 hypothetical protein BCV69DRAFT_281115 [Pseudomicrostroma glucosiphilum]